MKKILPFWIWPYTWGMAGKIRELAKAEYYLTGYELDSTVLDIRKDEYTARDYKERKLELERKYNRITQYEYDREYVTLIEDEEARELARLHVGKKHDKITDTEYEKAVATLKKQPWVTVLSMNFGEGSALEGSFELDWNEYFIKQLESEGYTGPTPDHVVNTWFMEVCKNVATEAFDGVGDFQANAEHNLETMRRWNTKPIDNKRASYS